MTVSVNAIESKTATAEPTNQRLAASRAAQAHGGRVEVETDRTDGSSLWANPDGTFTLESFTRPVRVKKDGNWQPVDTSLVSDAGLRPRTTTADIHLSDGGDEPFAEVQHGTHSFAVAWRDGLPAPRIQGDTATYKDVVAGGDLVVKALPNGFTHSIVLRSRPTQPLEIPLSVGTKGLTMVKAQDDGLDLRDSSGRLLASAPAPRMWDSSIDERSGEAAHQSSIETAVTQTAGGAALVLKPDTAFLADPTVKYPVTIDPTNTLTVETDTWVQSDIPDSQRGSTELKAGTYDGTHVARSYLKFRDIDTLRGTQIVDTDLRLWTFWSSVCVDPSAGVQARRVTADWNPDTIRYGSEPATTATGAVITRTAHGAGGCPQDFTHWDTDAIVQAWADGQPDYGIQLRGADENDPSTWRRFHSSNHVAGAQGDTEPALSVTFNYRLDAPTGLDLSPRASADPNVNSVASLTPTLSAKATDPYARPLDYTFEVAAAGGTTVIASGGPTGVASGTAATWQVPAGILRNPGAYRFRARAMSGTGAGGWSSWVPMSTDAPTVPSDLATGVNDPSAVVLSGVISRPSGDALTGRFSLFDAAGAVVGSNPIASSTVRSGQRVSVKLADGLLTPGNGYRWQMEACVESTCGAKTAAMTFTAPQAEPAKPTRSTALGVDVLTIHTAKAAPDACNAGPCPLETSNVLTVGDGRVSTFKADLSAIPAGAHVTSAVLGLGTPTCAGACPATVKTSAYEMTADPGVGASGADVASKLSDTPFAEVDLTNPTIDITGSAQGARRDGQGFAELALRSNAPATPEVTFGNPGVAAPLTLTVAYVPPGVPGTPQDISVRSGDGGALVTWAPPSESTGDTRITGFDLQVLNDAGAVVQTLTPSEAGTVVTGLTNGSGYRFQVRAKNEQGAGAWNVTANTTPRAVPGRQGYVDAVSQYLDSREGIIEGRFTDVADAIAKHAQSPLFESLLRADEQALLAAKATATAGGGAQESSTTTLSTPLVSVSADGLTATVRATVGQSQVQRDPTGERTTEESENAEDYSFKVPVGGNGQRPDGSADGLVGLADGASVDGQVYPNAFVTTDMDQTAEVPETTHDPAPPVVTPASGSGTAAWAVRHWNSHQEYDNLWYRGGDCTNFGSKALKFGGGAWEFRNHGSTAAQKRTHLYNWFWADPVGKDSVTFINVKRSMSHMTTRHRIVWRRTFSEVQVGDIMYWDFDPPAHNGPDHMSIVTKKTASNEHGIFYTQHSDKRVNARVFDNRDPDERIGYARLVA